MVNTLSGSVSAYRKEIVKPRFIRIDEVMALLDVTRDEAMDIALAAGVLSGKLNDAPSGRLFRADLEFLQRCPSL